MDQLNEDIKEMKGILIRQLMGKVLYSTLNEKISATLARLAVDNIKIDINRMLIDFDSCLEER